LCPVRSTHIIPETGATTNIKEVHVINMTKVITEIGVNWRTPKQAPINKIPEGFCGVSSHYPDINVVEKWARQGLEYLEVHVKRDNYDPAWCPRDNYVSITMSELAELCRRLKT
jgi:hypothetical protein